MQFSARGGYALIFVLSILSFILLLFMGFTLFVSLESKITYQRKSTLTAQRNAKVALYTALNHLQTELGSDQRVNAYIGSFDENSPHPLYIAVWDSINPSKNPDTYMVSGNNTQTQNHTQFTSGNNTIKVPLVPILLNNKETIGHYAYWIEDENDKFKTTEFITNQESHIKTHHSLGILSDTLNGGLKKDLTLCFENEFTSTLSLSPIFSNKETTGPSWDVLYSFYHLHHTPALIPNTKTNQYIPNTLLKKTKKNSIKPRGYWIESDSFINYFSGNTLNFFSNNFGWNSITKRNDPVLNAITPILQSFQFNLSLYSKKRDTDKFDLFLRTEPVFNFSNPYNVTLELGNYSITYDIQFKSSILLNNSPITIKTKLEKKDQFIDPSDHLFADISHVVKTTSSKYSIKVNNHTNFSLTLEPGTCKKIVPNQNPNDSIITTDHLLANNHISVDINNIEKINIQLYLHNSTNTSKQKIWEGELTPQTSKPETKIKIGKPESIQTHKNLKTFYTLSGELKQPYISHKQTVRNAYHNQKQTPNLWTIKNSLQLYTPNTFPILFNIHQTPPTSLGQFTHSNISFTSNMPTYTIGNSIHNNNFIYELNKTLFDSFFLSTLNKNKDSILSNHITIWNPTHKDLSTQTYDTIAQHLMINGAFNINSTNIEAWKLLLSKYDLPTSLASTIVENIKENGPFLSLSHFINGSHIIYNPNKIGILQQSARESKITQSYILEKIAPILTPRSDTFKIKAYGDSINPKTKVIESRAYCQAIVQRIPDETKVKHNRRFIITQFQWL